MPRHEPPDQRPKPFEGRLAISVPEACATLGIGEDTIYRLIHEERLIASKVRARTLIHVASIMRLLEETRIAPRPRKRDAERWANTFRPAQPKASSKPHHRDGKPVERLRPAQVQADPVKRDTAPVSPPGPPTR